MLYNVIGGKFVLSTSEILLQEDDPEVVGDAVEAAGADNEDAGLARRRPVHQLHSLHELLRGLKEHTDCFHAPYTMASYNMLRYHTFI